MDGQGARPPLLCPEPATWNTELESQPDPGSSPYLSHFLAVWTRTNHCPSLSLHVLAGKMVQEHLPGTLVKQKGKAAIGPGPDPEQGLPIGGYLFVLPSPTVPCPGVGQAVHE